MKSYNSFQEGNDKYKKFRVRIFIAKWFCQLVT